MDTQKETLSHAFPPVIDEKSQILILGSFPSAKSREDAFYYMHPQNRFWPLMAKLFKDDAFLDASIDVKKETLKSHHVALYDAIERCTLKGSKDSTIENAVPTDVKKLIQGTNVHTIALNGKKAEELFKKYNKTLLHMSVTLPSTSPANAQYDMDRLMDHWNKILRNYKE